MMLLASSMTSPWFSGMQVLAFGTQALYSALLSQGADVLQVPFFGNSVARGVWETRVQRVLCSQSIKKAQC
jgi:hypothetical protein